MTQESISPSPSNGSGIGFGGLEFSDAGRQFVLCRACASPGARGAASAAGASPEAPIRFEGHGNGERLDALLRRADVRRLRSLASSEEYFVLRMSDAQVRTAVAGLLRRGSLTMFEVNVPAASLLQVPRPAAALPAAVTVPRPPPPEPRRSARASTPSSPPPPLESGLPPGVDQDAQAAVLVAASKDGVPFCEECMKRARQREAENDKVLA